MNTCRICRTKSNLKYAPEQLAKKRKKTNANEEREIMDANASTLGNICFECEERLLNFHKLDDHMDLEVDSGREETPVIVDDDELLYNLFFERAKQIELLSDVREAKQAPIKHSMSSDCDTEVIKLPSSRESTPSLKVANEKIVAFIDLSDDGLSRSSAEKTISKLDTAISEQKFTINATNTLTIFNNGHSDHNDVNKALITTPNKKRKRHKKYDEQKLVVLAKLNLVSSDSEEDEIYPPSKRHSTYKLLQDSQQVENKSENVKKLLKKIDEERIDTAPDLPKKITGIAEGVEELLRQENSVRDRVKCAVCQNVFSCNQRLVHHMRIRHRLNEVETQLRERVRHAQDSALTIRLCFQGRYLYYECQLCGHIDCIFKEHKEHVIAKHSAELISLKDPLLKRLPCPVCKHGCGTLYIEVCRHMLQSHTPAQYKFFIKEIKCDKDEQLIEVANTARVYKFQNRLNLYYLCRQCNKLNSNINSHRKHIKDTHQRKQKSIQIEEEGGEEEETETNKFKHEIPCSAIIPRKLREKKKQEEKVSKNEILVKTDKKQIKTETETIGRTKFKPTKLKDSHYTTTTSPRRIKGNKQKKLFKTSGKKTIETQVTKRGRGRRAVVENIMRASAKVKPLIKNIPTQSFNCQHCMLSFKGFYLWNLHNLREHSDKEYYRCDTCNKSFVNNIRLIKHMHEHKVVAFNKHRRRKRVGGSCLTVDENSNTTKAHCCKTNTDKLLTNNNNNITTTNEDKVETLTEDGLDHVPTWVEELIQMHKNDKALHIEDEEEKVSLSSGLMEMKPNTAILEQTSNVRCIIKYNIATYAK